MLTLTNTLSNVWNFWCVNGERKGGGERERREREREREREIGKERGKERYNQS